MDKTAFFFGGLCLIVGLGRRERNGREGKKSKHRIIVAFLLVQLA